MINIQIGDRVLRANCSVRKAEWLWVKYKEIVESKTEKFLIFKRKPKLDASDFCIYIRINKLDCTLLEIDCYLK